MPALHGRFLPQTPLKRFWRGLALFLVTGILVSCAKNGGFAVKNVSSDLGSDQGSEAQTPVAPVGPGEQPAPAPAPAPGTEQTQQTPTQTPTPTPSVTQTPTPAPQPPVAPTQTPPPVQTPVEGVVEALDWDSPSHPERKQWSVAITELVNEHFDTLDHAQDTTTFCPNYKALNRDQRVALWRSMFISVAYFESAWDPTVAVQDVGTADNKDTWSVGLMQVSVVDQDSYRVPFGYTFEDLKDPIKNLNLAVAIMASQIIHHGNILITTQDSGVYWATIHPGGKYDKSAQVIATTKKLSFCQ